MRQGALWDMDGVLVDTGEFHYHSWVAVLGDYGIEFSRKFFRDTFGMNNRGILSLLLGEKLAPELLAEIGERKEEWFRDAVRGHRPGIKVWAGRAGGSGVKAWVDVVWPRLGRADRHAKAAQSPQDTEGDNRLARTRGGG